MINQTLLARSLRARRESRRGTSLLGVLVGVALGGGLGCGSDTTGPAPIPASAAYFTLQLNAHAITIDTGAMIQLTATPRTATGAVFTAGSPVTYTTHDTTITVSATGLVRARAHTRSPAAVVASSTAQGVTLVDTAFVQVTDTAPTTPLDTFSIQPLPGDSAKGSVNSRPTIAARAITAAGASLPVLAYYTSSDNTVATIDRLTGAVHPVRPGNVTFYATTWAYGVAKQDSLPYLIGYPTFTGIVATTFFNPPILTVGHGAQIFFANPTADTIDVTFADTSAITNDGSSFTVDGDCNGLTLTVTGGTFRIVGDTAAADANCDNGAGIGFIQMTPTLPDGDYPYHSHALGVGGIVRVRP